MSRGELWQYQARAEPTTEHESIVPSFGWFVQTPDPIPPLPPRQYQTRTEPLEPVAAVAEPDFGWFVQANEPVPARPPTPEGGAAAPPAEHESTIPNFDWWVSETVVIRPPHQVRPGLHALVEFDILPKIDWFVQEPEQVFQAPYQVRPGWFASGREEEIIEVDLDWFVQHPEPVLPLPQTQLGWFARGYDNSEITPDFDWFYQQADVVRPRHLVREGGAILGQLPIIPSLDWFHQQTDVIRPPHQIRSGFFALVEFSVPIPPEIPDIDWDIQEPDVIRPRHQVRPGLWAIGQPPITEIAIAVHTTVTLGGRTTLYQAKVEPLEPIVEIPDFGWYQQPSELVRRPSFQEGFYATGLDDSIATPAFDWYQQHPEPLPTPIRPEGFYARGYEDAELAPDFDWFRQYPEPLPAPRRPEGLAVLVEFSVPIPPEIVDLDWWVQEPDVFHQPHQIREGLFVLGEPPVIPDNGWLQPQIDIVRLPERRLEFYVLPLFVELPIPDFSWFQSQPDIVQPRYQVQPGWLTSIPPIELAPLASETTIIFDAEVFQIQSKAEPIPPPIIPAFDWLPAAPDVMLPLHLVRVGILAQPVLVIAAPITDLVYVVQICFGLDELERNRLLPQGSGFTWTGEVRTPSGWESDPDEECGPLEEQTYLEIPPTPSGWEQDPEGTSLSDLN